MSGFWIIGGNSSTRGITEGSAMAKVLITGVNGFIGKHLSKRLMSCGHHVVGLGRTEKNRAEVSTYICGSVTDKASVDKALNGCEAVFHLAALTAHADIVDNRYETLKINLEGTLNVVEAFNKSKKAQRIFFTSTGKVYGDILKNPIKESHPLRPLNALGKSKAIAESVVDFYASDERDYVVYRIFNAYGPGQKRNFLIPTILSQLEFFGPASQRICLGDTMAKRDYVYIDDLIDAFALGLEADLGGGFEAFNIASSRPLSAQDMVDEISDITGIKVEVSKDPSRIRKDEHPVEYGSYEKINRQLGWKPKTGIRQGIEKTLEAFK